MSDGWKVRREKRAGEREIEEIWKGRERKLNANAPMKPNKLNEIEKLENLSCWNEITTQGRTCQISRDRENE